MREISVGDMITVPEDQFCRRGQSGEVIEVREDGLVLDFFCGPDGAPFGVPSIEFWEYGELDI